MGIISEEIKFPKDWDSFKYTQQGYMPVRPLPDGTVIGVMKMITTWGLFIGIDDSGYERRYCYENCSEAEYACIVWDGEGDPPGDWLKEKPSERLGPGLIKKEKSV